VEVITSKRKPRKCAKCGSAKIVKIMYGYPSDEAFRMVEKGEIILGGCCEEIGAATFATAWNAWKSMHERSVKTEILTYIF